MKYDLYVVTDEGLSRGKTHAEIAREAVAGGADVIQLRDKTADSASLYAAACEIAEICRGKALFFVNDRLDIALAAGAASCTGSGADAGASTCEESIPIWVFIKVSTILRANSIGYNCMIVLSTRSSICILNSIFTKKPIEIC